MALINCPECNKEISDKAISCPHCGYPLDEMITCPECGKAIKIYDSSCPYCGCPAEEFENIDYEDDTINTQCDEPDKENYTVETPATDIENTYSENTDNDLSNEEDNSSSQSHTQKDGIEPLVIKVVSAIVILLILLLVIREPKPADIEKASSTPVVTDEPVTYEYIVTSEPTLSPEKQAELDKQKEQERQAAAEKKQREISSSLGLTAEEFKREFNGISSEEGVNITAGKISDYSGRFVIDTLTPGVRFSGNRYDSGYIREIIVEGTLDGTDATSANIFFAMAITANIADKSISTTDALEYVCNLYQNTDTESINIRNGLKYTVSIEGTSVWLVISKET